MNEKLHKKDVNSLYFDSLDTESAYWLGFLYGDGCIFKDFNGRRRLKLKIKDEEHLRQFADDIESAHDIWKNGGCYVVKIGDEHLIDRLADLGVDENKTKSGTLPNIDEFNPAFVRGLSDADGCIARYDYGPYYCLAGSKPRIKKVAKWFPVEMSHDDSDVYRIQTRSRKRINKIRNWLYPKGLKTNPALERKSEVFFNE